MEFTDEQMLVAVELFAEGKKRSEVVGLLIDSDPELYTQNETDSTLRKRLSDTLRTADPTSSRFSKTKYQAHFEACRKAYMGALVARYDEMQEQGRQFLQIELERIHQRRKEVGEVIQSALDMDVVKVESLSELVSAIKSENELGKQFIAVIREAVEMYNQED